MGWAESPVAVKPPLFESLGYDSGGVVKAKGAEAISLSRMF